MHRILLKLGPLNIYSYGTMLALAFLAGTFLAVRRGERQGLDKNKIFDLVFRILLSSLLGARILFVILEWQYYQEHILEIFKLWEGGLVFYGGFILALFASLLFLKKNKISFLKIVDILAPPLALGIAIGRIGCFLNGCCYGRISPEYGISFPAKDDPPALVQQVSEGLIASAAGRSLPVLPTQLYETLVCLAIFFLLLWLEKRKRFAGFSFWIFILLYSFFRFLIEGLRYYDANFIFGVLTISQIISAALFIISAVALIRGARKT